MKKEFLSIKKLIEKNGYKFTIQKRIILEELFNADIHLTAKEIYSKVKNNNIGLATVYRTMNLFTTIGIIKEIHVDGISYYELKMYSKKPLHIHFKCYKCNSIIDVDNSSVEIKYLKLNREIGENEKLQIHDANIMLIGLCDKCSEDKKL
ncbi:Fur family transcriptional regulator [Tepidibacter aestuarii]|uniref:Fur family transcriptional regulator n=1 Tax=Tepidibacter aestuarii TaxID=2925782 RepID=UPI0020BF6301|nr:transcriptional repressor [Tepidibacter aestuarii]CAH2211854.1 Fe2+ or Zn2+ uptake regulation protein [Tepidibacter aestuarii]